MDDSHLGLCRRHASLPTMPSPGDLWDGGGQEKRHSVATSNDYPIMTSNFLSYLLSIGSSKNEGCTEVKESTEIVYEFKEVDRLSMNSVGIHFLKFFVQLKTPPHKVVGFKNQKFGQYT